jgi:dipeptide/tripeptide permease
VTIDSPSSAASSTAEPVPETHPVAFRYFFFGEFAERCSFYGMKAILPLYFTSQLHFSQEQANPIFFAFKMAVYALPMLGGFLADRFFGKYNTIVWFAIPYVLGHFVLGIENTTAAVLALILLACGSGVIKPNISTLMGMTYDEQRPGQSQLRSSAFMWFYFAINVGAFIAQVSLPIVRSKYGYAAAFQFPAWLMVVSLGIFAFGKSHYAKETLTYHPPTPDQVRDRNVAVARLMKIFFFMILFWIPYEHNDSIWVHFIHDHVDLKIPFTSTSFEPDQLQAINPLCVMIFAPMFAWAFPKIDPQARIYTIKNKILMGYAIGIVSFGFMTWAAFLTKGDAKVSAIGVINAYVLLTIAEILIYGTGLDLAYSAAPGNIKGFITGCFLMTMAVANLINMAWSPFESKLTTPVFLAISAAFAVVGMIGMWGTVIPSDDSTKGVPATESA